MASSVARCARTGRGGVWSQPQVSLRMAVAPFDVAVGCSGGRGGRCQPQVSLRMAVAPLDVAVGCRVAGRAVSAPGVVAHGGGSLRCRGRVQWGTGRAVSAPGVVAHGGGSLRCRGRVQGGRGGRCQPQVSLRMAVAPLDVAVGCRGDGAGGVSPRCRCAWRWLPSVAVGGAARWLAGSVRGGSAPGVVAHGVASFLWRPIVRRDAGSLTRTYRCAWCASFGIRRQIARLGRGQPRRRCHDRPLSVAVIARGVISAEAAMDITRKSLMSEISCTG